MIVFDGNIALGFGPEMDYPKIQIFNYMLEQIDAVTIEFLKRITFIVGYPTAY
jgi:hypothetical protein